MTMSLVETIEVGSGGAASIEFTNIPQDGTDLLLVVSARSSQAAVATTAQFRYNGISTSTYVIRRLQGSGSGVGSGTYTATSWEGVIVGDSATSNTFGNLQLYIPNYTASAAKSASMDLVNENNATASIQELRALSQSGTNPITSLSISYSNLLQNSTASLYKITKA